jgi:hypothetical protein
MVFRFSISLRNTGSSEEPPSKVRRGNSRRIFSVRSPNLCRMNANSTSSRRSKKLHQPSGEIGIGIHLTLPENENIPSGICKLLLVLSIALDIPGELLLPEFSARFGHIRVAAIVAMPKAPVDKYYSPSRRKYNIGTAGQVLRVQPVPIAKAMQQTPDRQFGTGVDATDAPHQSGPAFRGHNVCRVVAAHDGTVPLPNPVQPLP